MQNVKHSQLDAHAVNTAELVDFVIKYYLHLRQELDSQHYDVKVLKKSEKGLIVYRMTGTVTKIDCDVA
jgi:hypothetical protein